jgi:hypothetical protein
MKLKKGKINIQRYIEKIYMKKLLKNKKSHGKTIRISKG